MEELKGALGYLYEEFGLNEVTIAFSQYLDNHITKIQREDLERWKSSNIKL